MCHFLPSLPTRYGANATAWAGAAGASVTDVLLPEETPGLRLVFSRMLDATDRLNALAATFPRQVRDRRLRLEVAVIVGQGQAAEDRCRR